jgi:hypothetical protein
MAVKKRNSIDLFLLGKFQKIADWFQDLVGINNFAIARFLHFTMIISFLVREALSIMQGIDGSEIAVIACSLMVLVKMELILNRGQQSVKKNPAFMNPVVSEYALTRLIMQMLGIASFGLLIKHGYYILNPSVNVAAQLYQWREFSWDLFGTLMFFVVYFSSCTPKPYKPSKTRKLAEAAADKMREAASAPLSKMRLA